MDQDQTAPDQSDLGLHGLTKASTTFQKMTFL